MTEQLQDTQLHSFYTVANIIKVLQRFPPDMIIDTPIPPGIALVGDRPPTDAEIQMGLELQEEALKWLRGNQYERFAELSTSTKRP